MLKCHLIQIEEKCGCCLIASARYSSEIDSQVQQFLQLQDPVLQTESGIAFMKTFKDNHYVINLIIVNYERENPLFKKAVKLAITPMIRLLDSMEHVKS